MSENNNVNAEVNVNELIKVRRDKLSLLKEAGNDPFVITKFDFDAKALDIKENFEEYEGKTVLLASHATPIRTQICRWKNEPLSKMQTIGWVPNASVTIVDYDTARHETILRVLGEAAFMGELRTTLPTNV